MRYNVSTMLGEENDVPEERNMTDNNQDNLFDEVDDDLLSMIQRWTEETQRAKDAKRDWQPSAADLNRLQDNENPWAAAVNRAIRQEEQAQTAAPAPRNQPWLGSMFEEDTDGLPPLHTGKAQSAPSPARKKREKKQTENKKRKHPFKRILALVLILVLVLVGGGYAAVYSLAGKLDIQSISSEDRAALFTVTGTTMVTNILLLGVETEGGGARADTMLLLSIDRVHRKLKLTSFLRDSWVTLPNGKSAKLNASTNSGGAVSAMRTISSTFNVRVDHYAMFSFESFAKIVDALGGVSVPIYNGEVITIDEKEVKTSKEIDFLCKETRLGRQIGKASMVDQMAKKGKVELTGEQALIFCRIRKLDDDFHRTQRQRRFINSLLDACKKNPLRLAGLFGDALGYIETDMTQSKIASLALWAPFFLGYSIKECTIPANGTWSYTTKQGASVIRLDAQANAAKLREFIYE